MTGYFISQAKTIIINKHFFMFILASKFAQDV